ncbi:MAG: SDR family oxidoreductase [Planctomycetes bacterium]|nr:SDR family oxidoreductase [Planctomycetota bacterium]
MNGYHRFLEGRVGLVTGSGRGIGRAYAERLARLGASVAVHDITEEAPGEFGEARSLSEVAEQVAGLGTQTLAVTGDLTRRDAVSALTAGIREKLGPIDILVNNAGGDIAARGGKADPNDCVFIPDEDAVAILDRNLRSAILCCQAVSPSMMERRYGRIVNISSNAAFYGGGYGAMYAVAKAGVVHFTRCLAAQLRDYCVTVNCIAPGNTPTARFKATRQVDPEWLNRKNTLNRPTFPEDLANVMEFFVSDLASFVSGQVISVDGGGRLSPG